MLKRLLVPLFALLAFPAWAQLPPSGGIVIDQTGVQGGTTTQCLYITSTRKVGSQACGGGTAADIAVGTTTVTGGSSGRLLYDNGTLGEFATSISGSNISFPGNISAVNGGTIGWTTRSALYSTSDGQMDLSNAALTTGVRLDFGTADTLKVLQRGGSTASKFEAGTINRVTITAPATGSTLTIADGKVLSVAKTLTLDGTDSTTMTFPTTTATIARTDAGQTFTGTQAFGAITYTTLNGNTWASGTGTLSIGAGKVFTASSTLTLTATDGSTLAIGTGGTLASAAYKATGTSGNTVPLLDGANTWSASQTLSAALVYGGVTLANSVTGTGSMVLATAPTLTNVALSSSAPTCGAGCASITGGNDHRFTFVTGTTVTVQVINFGHTWAAAPTCVANALTGTVIAQASSTTSAVTFNTAASVTSASVNVLCFD